MGPYEKLFRFLPANTAIGDGNAVLEILGIFGTLTSLKEVALKHGSEDVPVPECPLVDDVLEHDSLARVVLDPEVIY